MEFHPSKCQLLRITNKRKPFARDHDIHGHILEEVESAKYLGVTIQKNLSWNIHIDKKGELHQSLYPAEPKSLPQRRNPLAI
jgi:hypothetical protein